MSNLKPFTKWVGGKRQLLPELVKCLPPDFGHYYEPFIGGGALFFELKRNHCTINDYNSDLVATYETIRDDVDGLIELLKQHELNNSKDYYLDIRSVDRDGRIENMTKTERAARLIYMLRVNFNGLYRVNSKNQFNVPYGKYKNPKIVDENNLRNISDYLNQNNVKILNGDFTDAVRFSEKGDLIYFDPPYVSLSNTEKFTSYTSTGFSYEDQVRLRDLFVELTQKGVYVILSNSSAKLVYELYEDVATKIIEVDATRMINSKADKRGKIKELIITNF